MAKVRPPAQSGASVTEVWIPAGDFETITTAFKSTLGAAGVSSPVVRYGATATESATASAKLPDDWHTYDVQMWWANNAAGAGDVVWRVYAYEWGTADSITGGAPQTDVTATAGAQYGIVKTTLGAGLAHVAAKGLTVEIMRRGADAADTLANNADMLGVLLRKVT